MPLTRGIIAAAIREESRATIPGLIEDMAAQIPLKRGNRTNFRREGAEMPL